MALYKYHYIELDTKRSPRISLQNIVAGETGNRLIITVKNNGETVDMSEKSNGAFIYRVALRVDSDLGTRRQDSDDPDGGITFIEENTGDHGKINILLSADSYTVGKNRCRLEIYSKRSDEDDTLICSAEWTFDAAGNPTGENVGTEYPLMAYYEQLAKSWAVGGTGRRDGENTDNSKFYSEMAQDAVEQKVVSPSITAWLTANYPDIADDMADDIAAWLAEHMTNPSNPAIDTSLSVSGAAADAKVTGGVKQELENAVGCVNITLTSDVYISLNYNIGDVVVSITPSPGHIGWNCACVDCASGDLFTLNGTGGNMPRLYGFLDSTNHLLQKADNSVTASNLIIKAPDNAAKLVVNLSGPNVYAFKGKIVDAKIADVVEQVNTVSDRTVVLSIVENASGITVDNKLYNATSKEEVNYTNAQYCHLNNLTPGQKLCISGYVYSNATKYPLYAFYDNNNTLILSYGEPNTKYSNVIVTIPNGATKVYVNGSTSANTGNAVIKDVIQYPVNEYFEKNTWYGKRIGILGTSVAFGANAATSYGYEASKLLGFELSMFGVPGLAIEQNDDGTPKDSGSFTCSIAQYENAGWTIQSEPVTPYVPGGSYNNYYRTYENVFVADNADIDLWVYAVIPNNTNFALDDWNAFNKNKWKYNDNSAFSEHCKTFIGALLFVMDQMYRLNPNARMVFAVDSLFSYSTGLPALQTVASQWNIPIINLWGKINTSPKSMEKIKSINGTNSHPSTFAHEIMGKMFAGELGLVN